MPNLTPLNDSQPVEKRNTGILLESDSYPKQRVEAVCHHSDQYLSAEEINPKRPLFWRTHHEFPGFFELDKQSRDAAHSPEHQHLEVNWLGLIAVAGIVVALSILWFLLNRPVGSEGEAFPLSSEGSTLLFGAAVLLLLSIGLFFYHDQLYHLVVPLAKPKSRRFPIDIERMEIKAVEKVVVNLTNDSKELPAVVSRNGRLEVEVYPTSKNRTHYKVYKEIYGAEIAHRLFAGIIAITNHNHAEFRRPLSQGHRLVLSWPKFGWPDSDEKALSRTKSYTIHPRLLGYPDNPQKLTPPRFFISCKPKLHALDSRRLQLAFSFPNHPELTTYVIEELVLEVPKELRPVTQVNHGLYNNSTQEVTWRNITLVENDSLQVCFYHPILHHFSRFKIRYKLRIPDFLVSQIEFNRDHIWNAIGRRAQHPINTHTETTIEGNLIIESKHLSLSHEISKHDNLLELPELTEKTVHDIAKVLTASSVQIRRIKQANSPIAIEPNDRLSEHAQYWDIVGQRDYPKLADKLDVHLIITGHGGNQSNHHSENGSPPHQRPPATVDIRVSGRQEPRNHAISLYAQNLTQELRHEIMRKLNDEDETQQGYPYKLESICVIQTTSRIQITLTQIHEEKWEIRIQNIDGAHLYDFQTTLRCPESIRIERVSADSESPPESVEGSDNVAHIVLYYPEIAAEEVKNESLEVYIATDLGNRCAYDHPTLRQTISHAFNQDELENLYHDLNLDYQNVLRNPNNPTKNDYIRSLIRWGERNNCMDDIIRKCRKERPRAAWPEPYDQVGLPIDLQYKLEEDDDIDDIIQEEIRLDLRFVKQESET